MRLEIPAWAMEESRKNLVAMLQHADAINRLYAASLPKLTRWQRIRNWVKRNLRG